MISLPKFENEKWYQEQVLSIIKNESIKISDIDDLLRQTLTDSEIKELNNIPGGSITEKMLIAPFSFLNKLYNRFDSSNKRHFQDFINSKWCTKSEWNVMLKIYKKFSDKKYKINTGIIKVYGIKSCPYCNENYIFNRGRYSSAQLDHFFPKNQYPIMALSLYNLVPCCTTCNHIKSTKMLSVSPHDSSRDFSKMRISYLPTSADWIDNSDSIAVKFEFAQGDEEFENDMQHNLTTLHIDYSYTQHRDYAQEVLKKVQIYNNDRLDMLLSEFKDLFPNNTRKDLLQMVFSNYILEDELLNRPLSKLTRDLLSENGIILDSEN